MSEQTIIQGDCLEVMKTLPDKSFDLVLTDPPYDISDSAPGNSELMSLHKYNKSDFAELTNGFPVSSVLSEFSRLTKRMNAYIFCSNKQIAPIMTEAASRGWITTLLVWNKTNSAPFANGVWRQDAEFIIHIRESGACFEGGAELKRKVVQLPCNPSQFGHPTEKPQKLIQRYIAISSREGEAILDPYMGSGTTLVAAKYLNRNAVGIEISPKYCEIAQGRLAQGVLL